MDYEELGFVRIGDHLPHWINRDGKIVSGKTGRFAKSTLRKGCLFTALQLNSGKIATYSIARLVATVFGLPIPEDLQSLSDAARRIGYSDGNPHNTNYDNLRWMSASEGNFKKELLIRERWNTAHPLPVFDEANTGFYPNPIESTKPGYYHIPLCGTHVVINEAGDLYHLGKDRPHKFYRAPLGYAWTVVFSGIGHKSIRTGVHRLVAMLFCPIPEHHQGKSLRDLEVNHKDGDPTNNHYTNLEWMDHVENMKHAHDTGLVNHSTGVVLARCVSTGEILQFRSAKRAADHACVHHGVMVRHLSSLFAGRAIVNGFVYKREEVNDWPEILAEEGGDGELYGGLGTVAYHIHSRKCIIGDSIAHTCRVLGFDVGKVQTCRKANAGYARFERPYQGWLFVTLEEYLLRFPVKK